MSTDYCTRPEQGRHPHVSEGVLDGVARALHRDDVERDHLFQIARPRTERSPRGRTSPPHRVRPEFHQMLDILGGVSRPSSSTSITGRTSWPPTISPAP
ncbi:helix-turn-helix domain-containing protein [Streptomyces olivochromogenes]|uniref:helix-turn-helix domain-containing protein n=1 Tax=Streptomyces olivochromogenes TaxID=1963 RepID=UPI0036DEB7C5